MIDLFSPSRSTLGFLLAAASEPPDRPAPDKRFRRGLTIATWTWAERGCWKAWDILNAGGSALDAVEAGVMSAEDDPQVESVGGGGLPDASGQVTLDACVIDGPTRAMGAVASLPRIRNAIAVARRAMEKTRHIMLAGEGALQFARSQGFSEQDLLSERAARKYHEWKEEQARQAPPASQDHDTIAQLAQDLRGDLAGACSTSGLAWKLPGRVGDSAIPGAGLYVDNDVGAAGATGRGEIAIRHCLSFLAVELMRNGRSPQEACMEAIRRAVCRCAKDDEGGQLALIAINAEGDYGAYAIRPGFAYTVVRAGCLETRQSEAHFEAS